MAKIGFMQRTVAAFSNAARAIRTTKAGDRASGFGQRARKGLRNLGRRLGFYDDDAYEDEEQQRQRRRARQMIGLDMERRPSQDELPRVAEDEKPAITNVEKRLTNARLQGTVQKTDAADDEVTGPINPADRSRR
jgi:hypothetical protein